MSGAREFHTLDVFTDRVFGGNPLAVLPDAEGIDGAQMQRIAREFNLSETVFVLPPESADVLVTLRIFTPAEELPFAGHPTVGTAVLLADLGRVPLDADGGASFRFGEGVGAVPVRVTRAADGLWSARLTAARPVDLGDAPPADGIAAALGLRLEDIDGLPLRTATAGAPFTIVGLRDLDALARARADLTVWEEVLTPSSAPHAYLVVRTGGTAFRARMFGPQMGIVEDPATGAAATALAGYLGELDDTADGTLRWTVEQGVEMGRPSRLELEVEKAGGRVTAVHVGGSAVRVGQGTLTLPPA